MYREYYNLYKQADAIGEQLRSVPGSVATNIFTGGIGTLASGPNSAITSPIDMLASGVGMLGSDIDKKDIKKYNDTASDAYIPGIAAYRDAKRRNYTGKKVQKNKYKKSDQLHEGLSHLTYPILGSIGGSIAGPLLFKNIALYRGVPTQFVPQSAAMAGGVLGGLAGTGIDNYASILSRANAVAAGKPTFKEIKEYYEDPNRKLKTYFIPGYSSYHATRNAMASDIL